MRNLKKKLLNVDADKLKNSIENVISGDSLMTDITPLEKEDLKKVLKKNGWNFNWSSEYRTTGRAVYKLTIRSGSHNVQGVISLSIEADHVYIHLIESAPFNVGKKKVYAGVAGNLFAFARRLSVHHGFSGNVSFRSKTRLIEHYIKTLGAIHIGGHLMVLENGASGNLIDKYFSK